MPFIAITEKAFARLVNEHYEVLQRGIAMHKRLERIVLEERGLGEVVRALSAAIGGAVVVLDARGDELASAAFRRPWAEDALADLRRRGGTPWRRERRGNGHRPDAVAFAPQHPERLRPQPRAARGHERRHRAPGLARRRRGTARASGTSSA